MAEEKKDMAATDWELMDDFYQDGNSGKPMSVYDFMEPEQGQMHSDRAEADSDDELSKTVADVRKVMALAAQGKTTAEIGEALGFLEEYVYRIQVCIQGFHEDDEIAAAHLVMMG